MGTFLASKKVIGRLEPSNSSQTRPVPASIRPLMSAFECSQVAWCVLQPPRRAQPVGPWSGPSAEPVRWQRGHVCRRVGGLARGFVACSAHLGLSVVEGERGMCRVAPRTLLMGLVGSGGGPGC